uniref:Uncharacterized protein n=1 Tax=Parastrongyloides trichosuri TaxID=131310 RepID=A0A0N4ZYK1_PARTI
MLGNDNQSNKSKESTFYSSRYKIQPQSNTYQQWLTETYSTAPTRVLSVEESCNNGKLYVKHVPFYARQNSSPMLPRSLTRRKIQPPCVTRFYSQNSSAPRYNYSQSFDDNKTYHNSFLSPSTHFSNKFVDQSSAVSILNNSIAYNNNIEDWKNQKQMSLMFEIPNNEKSYMRRDTSYSDRVKDTISPTGSYNPTTSLFKNSVQMSTKLDNGMINKLSNSISLDKKFVIPIKNNNKCYDKYDDTIEFFHELHKNGNISRISPIKHNLNKCDDNNLSQKRVSIKRGYLKRQCAAIDDEDHYKEQYINDTNSRSVVDVTDHKTCALLMSKMKEASVTISPS